MPRPPKPHSVNPNAARAKALFVQAAEWLSRQEWALAEQTLEQHLALLPGSWPGLSLKALLAEQTGRAAMAEQLWTQLLQVRPDHAQGHCHLGYLCDADRRFAQAQTHFNRALALEPDHPAALRGLGLTCQHQGSHHEALQWFGRLAGEDADIAFLRGVSHQALGQVAMAVQAYERAVTMDPTHPLAASNLLLCQHYQSDLSAQQRAGAVAQWGRLVETATPIPAPARVQERSDGTLRIGLVSADLRQHPVGRFLEPVLAAMDTARWPVYAFSGAPREDALSQRLRTHCAGWHAVHNLSDAQVAQHVRETGIDVLIDLSGHTAGHRLGVFARRSAPLQLSWLGYFASTGLSRMDFLLADPVCVPLGEEGLYTERIWRLPNSRLCYGMPPDAPDVSTAPVLRTGTFTFGSFQAVAKMNDSVLQTWARVMAAVPQSRLRIQSAGLGFEQVAQALRTRMQRAGLDLARCVLVGPGAYVDYLRSHAEVDLLLDTFPYPGGTTTIEALWMGVPTLTLAQAGMLSRQGEALLRNVGLHDWVCADLDSYVSRATLWSSTQRREDLIALRRTLRAQLQASPLMDAPAFARDLQSALRGMWQARCDHLHSEQVAHDPGK